MTASTTRATQRTVAQLIENAYRVAGLMSIEEGTGNQNWPQKLSFGMTLLDTLLDEVQVYGVYARQTILEDTSLTEDDYTYTMNDYVLDIVGDGMYIDADQTDLTKASGETVVRQIRREEWHRISSKDAKGRPSLFFYDRALQEAKIWPIPDEDGTIRFQIYRFMSDAYEGGATLELRQYWDQYLIWELAHQLATSGQLSVERCSYLNKRSKEKKDYARAWANQHPDVQVQIEHSTPWSGSRR
jgi:hypothetical protein